MIPIVLTKSTRRMKPNLLKEKIDYYTYKFCVLDNHTDAEYNEKLISNIEKYFIMALIKICKTELGFNPKQNKIFERVEEVFNQSDAYNINRSISALRRAKISGIDASNEKYMFWFENRILYAAKAINVKLEEISFDREVNFVEKEAHV